MKIKELGIETITSDEYNYVLTCKLPLLYLNKWQDTTTAYERFSQLSEKEFWTYVSVLVNERLKQVSDKVT